MCYHWQFISVTSLANQPYFSCARRKTGEGEEKNTSGNLFQGFVYKLIYDVKYKWYIGDKYTSLHICHNMNKGLCMVLSPECGASKSVRRNSHPQQVVFLQYTFMLMSSNFPSVNIHAEQCADSRKLIIPALPVSCK